MNYSSATTKADHITTRLAIDSREVLEVMSQAERLIENANPLLFQLDRLTGLHKSKEAKDLAAKIRESMRSLGLLALTKAEQPPHPITWSVDARDHYIGSTLLESPAITSNLGEGLFDDPTVID